jgi:hypothetical protein
MQDGPVPCVNTEAGNHCAMHSDTCRCVGRRPRVEHTALEGAVVRLATASSVQEYFNVDALSLRGESEHRDQDR